MPNHQIRLKILSCSLILHILVSCLGLRQAQDTDLISDGLWLTLDPADGSGDLESTTSSVSSSSFFSTSRNTFTFVSSPTTRLPITDSPIQSCLAPFYLEEPCSDLVVVPLDFKLIYPLDELCRRYPSMDKAFLSSHFTDLIRKDKDLEASLFKVDITSFIMLEEVGNIIVDRCAKISVGNNSSFGLDFNSITQLAIRDVEKIEWKKVDVSMNAVFKKDVNFKKFLSDSFPSGDYKPIDLVTKLYSIIYKSLAIQPVKTVAVTALKQNDECAYLDTSSQQEICKQILAYRKTAITSDSLQKCMADLDKGADFSDYLEKKYVPSQESLVKDFVQKDLCNIHQKTCRNNDICKDLIFGVECLCKRPLGKQSLEPSSCTTCNLPCEYSGRCFYQGKSAKCGCLKLAFGEYCANDGLVVLLVGFLVLVGLLVASVAVWMFFLFGLCRQRRRSRNRKEDRQNSPR